MEKLPLGISDFNKLREGNYFYADKTNFIETIEEDSDYFMILRPRRFGKSLFLSTLDYYYNINHKEKFEKLFKGTYIYDNPTLKKNSYLVLKLNFSAVDTKTSKRVEESFVSSLRKSLISFVYEYNEYFDKSIIESVNYPPLKS